MEGGGGDRQTRGVSKGHSPGGGVNRNFCVIFLKNTQSVTDCDLTFGTSHIASLSHDSTRSSLSKSQPDVKCFGTPTDINLARAGLRDYLGGVSESRGDSLSGPRSTFAWVIKGGDAPEVELATE